MIGGILGVRQIAVKHVSIDPVVIYGKNGELELKVINTSTGEHLCVVNAWPGDTLCKLKRIITEAFVEGDIASQATPIMFGGHLAGAVMNATIQNKFDVTNGQKVKKVINRTMKNK